jgi:hypothetical protein
MSDIHVVDTYPSFLACWERIECLPAERQADEWLADFRAAWPELARMYEEDYTRDGLDWRQVLAERVFPGLADQLPVMGETRDALPGVVEDAYAEARAALGLDFDVTVVIVAIGYGGWATCYEGRRAVLVGLDTLASLSWTDGDTVQAFLLHELGHLLHAEWRARAGVEGGQGPLWQIYEEGFAQRCEHVAMGCETFHMRQGQGEGWLDWCRGRRSFLAREYLAAVEAGEPVYRFFGSWPECHIEGWREGGHFLGHEVVVEWQAESTIHDIATLPADGVEARVRATLERMAQEPPSQ